MWYVVFLIVVSCCVVCIGRERVYVDVEDRYGGCVR